MRLRSILSIPAGGAGLSEALESQADAVLLTLADDILPVADLRTAAIEATKQATEAGKTVLIAVNHPRTKMLRDDIEAVLSPSVKAIVLHHATEPQDIRDTAVLLREFELKRDIEPGDTEIFPVIDTARGLVRSADIAAAAPRVGGLVFHSRNYAHDVGARDEQRGDRLAYARGQVVAVSRAYGGQPLVVADGLESQYLSQYGFAGVILRETRNVPAANAAFTPYDEIRNQHQQALERFEQARIAGALVARHGDRIVDSAAARRARRVVE
ncbi:MAG: aldolase/citrate lyase family protein [Dehalococcoidia bacterium]